MQKKIVLLNGVTQLENQDYKWYENQGLTFANPLHADNTVTVETYDEGVLILRESFVTVKGAPREAMKWHRRITDRFRDKDC